MTIRYIDFNRGSDGQDGSTPAKAWKNLAMMYNFPPGADGGIYLASDSAWEINPTRAAHLSSVQTLFSGTSGHPAFITSFDPVANTTGQKPTIRYRMFPVPSDWTWDATDNFGYPKGWYIQLQWSALSWDILVMAGGQYAGTMNQEQINNTGNGYINGSGTGVHTGQFVNGMTRNSLRFNFDYSGANVGGNTNHRLYLSGAGLLTPGAGNDPSSVYGPNQIMIGWRPYFYFSDCGSYVTISNVAVEQGGGLICLGGSAARVAPGFEVHDCSSNTTNQPVMILQAVGTAADTKITIDIHDNVMSNLSGPAFTAYKWGIAGYFRNNTMTNGNLCSSQGGGVYAQVEPSTYGGTRDPLIVEYNIADTWKNGAGNNAFDGGCYYADIVDNGTIFRGNIAKNSYVAFQCGSGARSEWYANQAINCEKFGMWNNATVAQASDYRIVHNLGIIAAQGTFTHGDDTQVTPAACVVTHTGTESNLVGVAMYNNAIVLPAGDTRVAANVLTTSHWAAGRAHVNRNVMICDDTKKLTCDVGVTDKTSAGGCLAVSASQLKFCGPPTRPYDISASSALWAAGVELSGTNTDKDGNTYYSPPSIGPHEPRRKSNWFAQI